MTTQANQLVNQFKKARRASVPLVAISSPDQFACVELLSKSLNGKTPMFRWDYLRGVIQISKEEVQISQSDDAPSVDDATDPAVMLQAIQGLPDKSVVFMLNAHRFWESIDVVQGISNLRDTFKQNFRQLVMLAPSVDLPAELKTDVVCFDEQLPGKDEIESIVTNLCADTSRAVLLDRDTDKDGNVKDGAKDWNSATDGDCLSETGFLEGELLDKSVSATQGLPSFSIEQITAMSLDVKSGLDMDGLWELKRQQIEQTPGLSVFREGLKFSDIGGLTAAKEKMLRLFSGRQPAETILLLDELEKAMGGSEGDNTGVSQDFLGTILTYMERHKVFGVLFVGLPGTGKSAIAESTGNEFGIPTICCDLGGMKQKELGESEANIRTALKVTTAMSNGRPMFIATANSVKGLDSALRDRFTYTYYFDVPTLEERQRIFAIWMEKYGVEGDLTKFEHEGWTGRNIQRCCLAAYQEDRRLEEVAVDIVSASVTAASELDRLRSEANGRYLSAAYPGPYTKPAKIEQAVRRPVGLEE